MAELVQRNVELLLPIFNQLERDGVFDQTQLRQIAHNVEEHEYNLQRANKEKELFIAYLNYMQSLLLLIEKRYKKQGNRINPDVRHQLLIKIKLLFRKVIFKHQGDLSLWFSFINFAKRRFLEPLVGKLYNRMLQVHADKAQVWISAAKWAFESNTPGVARKYFQRGLRSNPESRELHVEYFRFELLYIELILKRKEVLLKAGESGDINEKSLYDFLPIDHLEDDKILAGDVAKAIFKDALINCDNSLNFVQDFIQVLHDFSSYPFSKIVKTYILDYLKENFDQSEQVWNLLAISVSEKHSDEETDRKRLKSNLIQEKDAFDRSSDIFQEALQQLPTEQMWTFYLSWLLQQIQLVLMDEPKRTSRMEQFLDQLKTCWDQNLVSKQVFLLQLNHFKRFDFGSSSDIKATIQQGLKKWEQDVEVWNYYIQYVMAKEHDRESKFVIKSLFSKALNRLLLVKQDNAELRFQFERNFVDFVQLYVNWLQEHLSDKECILMLEKASILNVNSKDLRLARKLAAFAKPILLQKLAKAGDPEKVRRCYEKLHLMNPITLDFYQQMLNIELCPGKQVDVKFVRRLFNEMLAQFGQDDHKLWIRFAHFELEHGTHVKASDVYHLAKTKLTPKQSSLFVQEYQMIHCKSSSSSS